MNQRAVKWISVMGLCALVATACGQKPNVAAHKGAGKKAVIDPVTGELIDPQSGDVVDSGTIDLTSGGGSSSSARDDLVEEGADSAGGKGAEVLETSGGKPPTGGVRTGVTDSRITIGSHAPLTGAAPVPSDSVQKAKDLFFKWLEHNDNTIQGRNVEVVLKNDNYNTSQAVAVCKEMVEQDEVFLLTGDAGTDQIVACARYAASAEVPYLSVGVTEIGLDNLSNYFVSTMTYPDQGPLLADYLVSRLGAKNKKNGMLYFDTGNFEDAHDAFVDAMSDAGVPLDYDRAVRKSANKQDAEGVVQEMKLAGIDNVFVLTSPVWWLQVLDTAQKQQYSPQWVGVGITMTFDTVANIGCRNGTINGAKFFAPYPAWIDSNEFDPDFQKAIREFYPNKCNSSGCGDDFMVAYWMLRRTTAALLELPGRNLTRERFVWFSERVRGLKSPLGPTVNFSPEDHFGADQVHVNEAQCSGYKAGDNRWHTIESFVSDF